MDRSSNISECKCPGWYRERAERVSMIWSANTHDLVVKQQRRPEEFPDEERSGSKECENAGKCLARTLWTAEGKAE